MPEVVFATHALTETYISGEVAVQTWLPGSLDGFATGAAIGIVIALVIVPVGSVSRQQARTYDTDWYGTETPTAEELEKAYADHSQAA